MTDRIKGAIIGALLLLIALSAIGNFFLYHGYTHERDRAVKLEAEKKNAADAAASCSASIDGLVKAAEKRGRDAERARADARARADKHRQAADQILTTPASVPGNDCESARDRALNWLHARVKP
jgi:hypothetical protein